MNKKKTLIVLLAVLAIIASGLLILSQTGILKFGREKTAPVKQADLPPPPKYTKTDLPIGKLPEVFPKDLVQEKDAVIFQSYYTEPFPFNKELTMYQIQSAFRFITKKDMAENFTLYGKYLKDNGWQTINSIDEKDVKMITAIKGPDRMSITFSVNSLTKEKIVDASNIHIGMYSQLNKSLPAKVISK